jgi:hypothetical protein
MPALPGKPRNRGKNLAEREVIRWNRQRTETQRHICEKYSLENQILKAEVLKKSELVKGLAMIADAITTRIMDSDLSRSAKEDILTKRNCEYTSGLRGGGSCPNPAPAR